jgi:tetratricopeptide (TPR) repeat protein
MDRSYATQVALAPLAPAESRRIVGAVAGSRALPDSLVERVLAWAEGNPLFLEELTRAMLDASPAAALAIPRSVQAVIAARIDRLAAADKRLLQVAAVIGREVSLDVLERVADLGVDALREGLARLQAAELLLERRARAVPTYGFKHAVTQAAAYQGVPAAARSALHARVLEAHVALGDASRPDALPALAEHAAAAGDWRRALGYAREAGLRLLARDANHEAARCFEQALDALSRLGPGAEPEDVRLSCDLRFEALQVLYRIGDLARASALATEAIDLAQRLGDPARQAQVLGMLAHALANEGRYADSMHAGERALALARAHGLATVEVWAGIIVGRTCLALGRFAAGIEHLRRVIAVLGEDGDRRHAGRGVVPPSPQARSFLALCLARTGDFDEAVGHAEEAARVAEAIGGSMDRAWAYYALGRVHHARTDWERAIPFLERAAALCASENFTSYRSRVLSGLASAYAQSGRVAEAVPLLEQALAAGRAIRMAYGESLILCQLGTTCVAAGRLEEAAGYAQQALALACERGERGEEAWALLLSGEVAAYADPPRDEAARAWYGQAIALGEELGMRPLAARAQLELGALQQRIGRVGDGYRHLALAAAAARAMGIAAWQARAEELAPDARI